MCGRTGWRVHAWVLMGNHYHLLVETPQTNLVAGMRWFQTTYTVRFNGHHRLSGHLFQGWYKAVVVDPEERGYFATLSDYIHLNPVRARLVGLDQRLFDYRWSSYRCLAAKAGRSSWFTPEWVLGELSLADAAAGRRAYAERMRCRAVEELSARAEPPALAEVRRGWCLGGPAFRFCTMRKDAGHDAPLGGQDAHPTRYGKPDRLGLPQLSKVSQLTRRLLTRPGVLFAGATWWRCGAFDCLAR